MIFFRNFEIKFQTGFNTLLLNYILYSKESDGFVCNALENVTLALNL